MSELRSYDYEERRFDSYGKAVYDFSEFSGFRQYDKDRFRFIEEINSLWLYLKLSGDIYYFEHNDYISREYSNDYLDGEPEKINFVRMDWVVFGFDDIKGRISEDSEGNFNDLVIAIDVFENGNAKLRIHSPRHCLVKFNEHFRKFDGKLEPGYFMTMKEEEFCDRIRDLLEII